MIRIETRTVFVTDDGVEHSSIPMAEQHVLTAELSSELDNFLTVKELRERHDIELPDGHDVLNFLSGRQSKVRAWLDATAAMATPPQLPPEQRKIEALIGALNMVNKLIFSKGAPLGSSTYVRIRTVAVEAIQAAGGRVL